MRTCSLPFGLWWLWSRCTYTQNDKCEKEGETTAAEQRQTVQFGNFLGLRTNSKQPKKKAKVRGRSGDKRKWMEWDLWEGPTAIDEDRRQ